MKLNLIKILLIICCLTYVETKVGFKSMYEYYFSGNEEENQSKKKKCINTFSWKDLNYETAKGYYFADYKSKNTGKLVTRGKSKSIIKNGKLNKAVWDKKGVTFSKSDIDKLINPRKYYDLENTNRPELLDVYTPEFCHDPHHGIVFWDENNCPQAYISICYYCNSIEYNPKTEFPGINIGVSKILFEEKGIKPTSSYNEILEFNRVISNEYDLDKPIYEGMDVDGFPKYKNDNGNKLIQYLNSKGNQDDLLFENPTLDSIIVKFVIEPNGDLNLLELPKKFENNVSLLWLWETKWTPAIRNNEKVRYRMTKVFYKS